MKSHRDTRTPTDAWRNHRRRLGLWAHDLVADIIDATKSTDGFPIVILGEPSLFVVGHQLIVNTSNTDILGGALRLQRILLHVRHLAAQLDAMAALKEMHR